MKASSSSVSRFIGTAASLIFLGAVFAFNSLQNATHEDYRNANFAKFWIAGHMVLTGQNPYDPAQWYSQHLRLGSTWTPDRIFLYPLPQAFFVAPLALLPPAESFIVWGIISQAIIATSCFALLNRGGSNGQKRLFLPLVIFLLFFGPVYLGLQIGSIGVIALAVLAASILLLDANKSLLAGVVLSVLTLKPPQGLPILFLVGLWFLFKHDGKAILGIMAGGLILVVVGLLYDPHWMEKFISNSEVVSSRTLGAQSNLWSISYLICNRNGYCTAALGSVIFVVLLAFGGWMIWRHRASLTPWEALNIIIPISFVCALYLFAYDQILYLFPIVWICGKLVQRTKSYLPTFLFLIFLDVMSFGLLLIQATTQSDTLNIITTITVLGLYLWLLETDKHPALEKVRVG